MAPIHDAVYGGKPGDVESGAAGIGRRRLPDLIELKTITPLMIAGYMGNDWRCTRLLIEAGADVDI